VPPFAHPPLGHAVHAGSIKRTGLIDTALGRRIRALRLAKGVSQSALARRLGVQVQQIQKYEKGAIRIGVGRLIEIAAAPGRRSGL